MDYEVHYEEQAREAEELQRKEQLVEGGRIEISYCEVNELVEHL